MTFADLKKETERLRARLRDSTGLDLIDGVFVDEPDGQLDELHFIKLVSWCYVLLFEAGQPATRHIVSLFRVSSPEQNKVAANTMTNVNNLRTVRFHNLKPDNGRDEHKRHQAQIWIFATGGTPTNWTACCDALCAEVTSLVKLLLEKWEQLLANPEDSAPAIDDLRITVQRQWPPHSFDAILADVANDLALHGFDQAKYRETRLQGWREMAALFESRDHAKAAMKAAIYQELERSFGSRDLREKHAAQSVKADGSTF